MKLIHHQIKYLSLFSNSVVFTTDTIDGEPTSVAVTMDRTATATLVMPVENDLPQQNFRLDASFLKYSSFTHGLKFTVEDDTLMANIGETQLNIGLHPPYEVSTYSDQEFETLSTEDINGENLANYLSYAQLSKVGTLGIGTSILFKEDGTIVTASGVEYNIVKTDDIQFTEPFMIPTYQLPVLTKFLKIVPNTTITVSAEEHIIKFTTGDGVSLFIDRAIIPVPAIPEVGEDAITFTIPNDQIGEVLTALNIHSLHTQAIDNVPVSITVVSDEIIIETRDLTNKVSTTHIKVSEGLPSVDKFTTSITPLISFLQSASDSVVFSVDEGKVRLVADSMKTTYLGLFVG